MDTSLPERPDGTGGRTGSPQVVPVAVVGMGVIFPGAPDLQTYWNNLVAGYDAITDVPERRWDARYYEPLPDGPSSSGPSSSGPSSSGPQTGRPPAGPLRRADQIYCRRGGFVDGLAFAEPGRIGLTAEAVGGIEPEQLIALQVATAAVDDAGGAGQLGDLRRAGVVLGRGGYLSSGMVRLDQRVRTARQLVHTLGTLLPALASEDLERVRSAFVEALGPATAEATLGLVPNLTASRVAGHLGLRGPAYTVDAACASSLIAVDSAVAELASGRCDAVLAGGVHHCHDVTLWSMFAQAGALSASQLSRPFHRDADGLLLGEGTGVVVLKRLADARAAGDRIYAVIRGTGVSSGGVDPAADPEAMALAMRRAWVAAGLDPRAPGAVGLIEAHGAGIPDADAAELAALAQVFGSARDGDVAVIGSVKSMIGHAMSAAGMAGLIKAALAVYHGVLPPTLNCERPHQALDGGGFHPLGAACPWVSPGPRRAGVNAFGFGGVHAHAVLEQVPGGSSVDGSPGGSMEPAVGVVRPVVGEVEPAVGRTEPVVGGVRPAVGAVEPGLGAVEPAVGRTEPVIGVAGPPAARPTAGRPLSSVTEPERILRFAVPTPEALIEALDGDDATVRERGEGVPSYRGPGSRLGLVGPTERRLAVARRVARGARGGGWAAWRGRNDVWLSSEPLLAPAEARTAFVFPGLEAEFAPRIDDVVEHFGLARPDLSAQGVGRHGSAVLRIGRVLEQALRRMGVVPDALAGHSIGEWSAMFAAGMFDEATAEEAIFGPAMADLAAVDVEYASMACPLEEALEAIADHPDITLSHDNAPLQTVVCGPPESVRELAARQRHRNVLVQIMPFRSGFHTPMLAPYLEEIGQRVAAVPVRHLPRPELWSATLADRYPGTIEEIRALVLRHLVEPVRFRPTVLAMYRSGVRVFIQVGQGRIGNLIDDTLGARPHLTIAANSSRRCGLDQLRRVAVALWVEGGSPDFGALDAPAGSTRTGTAGAAPLGPLTGVNGRPAGGSARTSARRSGDGSGGGAPAGGLGRTGGPGSAGGTATGGPGSAGGGAAAGGGPGSGVDPGRAGGAGADRPGSDRVPLELGSGLVTLDPGLLSGHPGSGGTSVTAGLEGWARRDPVANELLGLLTETAQTAAEALEAAAGADGPPVTGRRDWLDHADQRPAEPEPEPIEALSADLRISVESMPFLLDHCVAPQRSGWPEPSDLRPVVPATTIVKMMVDLAERAAPGRVAVGLSEVRFDGWLVGAPPVDVTARVGSISADSVSVSLGGYARSVVRLAPSYPDTFRPRWPHEGLREKPPAISAAELYGRRWMFHGPRFQGVAAILGHGDNHARGVLNATSAPGSLLDAAGQLLAYFARVNLPERYVIFPGAIDQIEFYGPEPAPGTPVTCMMWVPWHNEDWLNAFFQFVVDGRVWAEVNGWRSRRFDVRPETDEVFRFPERKTIGRRMPGGWTLVAEPWSDLASRELFAGRYLGAAEREEMRGLPPRRRRSWLLGRVALKDAVRARLWDGGTGPVFPAELRVANAASGAPTVDGEHGLELPPLRVSIAHSGEVAVAIAQPGVVPGDPADGSPAGVGIDVEEIRDHPESTLDAALTPAERVLVDEAARRTGLPVATWFTRFWTAKEAAAKAAGTGLGGAPRRFVVGLAAAGAAGPWPVDGGVGLSPVDGGVGLSPVDGGVGLSPAPGAAGPWPVEGAADRLVVTLPSGAAVDVLVTEVSNPPGLPKRDYVVAWTGQARAHPKGVS